MDEDSGPEGHLQQVAAGCARWNAPALFRALLLGPGVQNPDLTSLSACSHVQSQPSVEHSPNALCSWKNEGPRAWALFRLPVTNSWLSLFPWEDLVIFLPCLRECPSLGLPRLPWDRAGQQTVRVGLLGPMNLTLAN